MDRSDKASSCSVRRGRRPHSTPRNFMHENRETSETPAAQPGSRSGGEGSGHTARMHVSEESHSGIVPMNHSNKDTRPSAESGEGRPLIKENAGPASGIDTHQRSDATTTPHLPHQEDHFSQVVLHNHGLNHHLSQTLGLAC